MLKHELDSRLETAHIGQFSTYPDGNPMCGEISTLNLDMFLSPESDLFEQKSA